MDSLASYSPADRHDQRTRRRWARISTTPGRLRVLLLMIVVGSALLWVLGGTAVVIARADVDSLGYRTAPAVVNALRLHADLADADRLAANDFLLGAQGNNEKRQEYDLDIATATRELEQAAELNEPGGQAGQQLQAIDAMLIEYADLVENARANAHPASAAGAAYLRQASTLMHQPDVGILARVDTLAAPDPGSGASEEARLSFLRGTVAAFFAVALALLGSMVYTQTFLRRRFRRQFSPPILAAVLLLVTLSALMALQASTTYRNLSAAEGVAFTELHRLSMMKSLAFDANADESLSLIARGRDGQPERDFDAATARLVNPPLTDDMADAAMRGDIRFNGLLADELHDAAAPEDRAAVRRVLRGYQEFLAVDASFRAKALAGKYDDATALVVGSTQLGTAFADLSIALEQRIDVEQTHFNAAVSDASPGLDADICVGLGSLTIALFGLRALMPRMAEYSGVKTVEQPGGRRGPSLETWARLTDRLRPVRKTG